MLDVYRIPYKVRLLDTLWKLWLTLGDLEYLVEKSETPPLMRAAGNSPIGVLAWGGITRSIIGYATVCATDWCKLLIYMP